VIVPPLLTLADAKVHLHLTGTDYDADVQQKLTEAQDAIIDYLAEQVDPLWTDTTVPPRVLTAIKFYLDHLWENRGGDMTPDEKTWAAIRQVLARSRMQAIGTGA
jgi:hypothetical protein